MAVCPSQKMRSAPCTSPKHLSELLGRRVDPLITWSYAVSCCRTSCGQRMYMSFDCRGVNMLRKGPRRYVGCPPPGTGLVVRLPAFARLDSCNTHRATHSSNAVYVAMYERPARELQSKSLNGSLSVYVAFYVPGCQWRRS